MFTATVVVSIVLAAALAFTAARKLSHDEEVVRAYARVGVRENQLNQLATILLAGAAGLLAGLAWAPVGIAAGAGLVVYFMLAVTAHVRCRDTENLPTPVAMELAAAAALALRIATL